jgi:hypothetical protein
MRKTRIVVALIVTALLLLGACVPAPPPSPGSGVGPLTTSTIRFEDSVQLKAGETKSLDVALYTKKDFGPGPREVSYKLFRVAGYVHDEIPMPEWLEVSIEPAKFMAYPYAEYHSTITIKTTPELSPGGYYFRFESESEGSPMWTGGWITVTIE